MGSSVVRIVAVAVLSVAFLPHLAFAQDQRHPRWEVPGLDFRPDGAWRKKARAVRTMRARLLAARRFSELNAAATLTQSGAMLSQATASQQSATAVTGTLVVPAILIRFRDSPTPAFTTANYNDVLFGVTPTGAAAGRPYTYRSFYREMSNGMIDIQGQTYGYVTLDSNEVYYNGGTSSACQTRNPYKLSNCNGIWSDTAQVSMQRALKEALQKIDATVDFSQYVDPATGYVPLVLFMHEAVGGECGPQFGGANHLWAHRFALFTDATTQDAWPGHPGQKVKISDYILQPAVGGANACTATQIMPIGTVAHETGHSFGLPDLYDVSGPSEGVGEWSLMGSGNFTSPLSPARMDAWSLGQLGWITLAPLSTNTTPSFDAAPLSDTAFYVNVPGANPRGEYFLLENRQRQQSDSAMIRAHCHKWGIADDCPGGLLIWHVDGTKMNQPGNGLNSGNPHGLEVVQADAFGNLDADAGNACTTGSVVLDCSDRGDAGDVYPGATGNSALIYRTNPASLKNSDGSFTGIAIDSIRQLTPGRTMSFRLRFGALTVAKGSDTSATIQFDGSPYNVFRDLLDEGSSHTVGFADNQLAGNARTRFHFVSWSDGGAKDHTVVGHLSGGPLTATLSRDFKLIATSTTGGRITADTAVNLTGDFIPENRAVILTPIDTSLGFCGWTGDSTSTDSVITLGMKRPYTLVANFGSAATITSAAPRPNGVMGAGYTDTLRISGGGGAMMWSVTGGALPQGVTLSSTGYLSGYPQGTGTFNYTATVVSCSTTSKAFSFSVTAPTLTTADVVAQLLGPTAPLTADQVRYLDFLGNKNNGYDVGDFLAWVKATGAPLSPGVLQAAQRTGARP